MVELEWLDFCRWLVNTGWIKKGIETVFVFIFAFVLLKLQVKMRGQWWLVFCVVCVFFVVLRREDLSRKTTLK